MTKQRYLSILEEIKKSGGKVDSGEPNDSVLLIDGLNTFIRVFSAIPTTNEDGVHIGGIVGFLRSIGYTINMVRPTRTIIVFDGKGGSNRRRKIFPQYKMGRKMSHRLNRTHDFLTREEEKKMMVFQLNRIVQYLECLPLTIINMDNIEADDVIGYCAKHIFKGSKSTIMSTDKDFLQLVDENIKVYSPTKKKMYFKQNVIDDFEKRENSRIRRFLRRITKRSSSGIKIKGHDDKLVRFAKCCDPIPGDPVTGFITRGKGISIHAKDCANISEFLNQNEQLLEVVWDDSESKELHPVPLSLEAKDEPGVLAEISAAIAKCNANIAWLSAKTQKQIAGIQLEVQVYDLKHLKRVTKSIRKLNTIKSVNRLHPSIARNKKYYENEN